VSDFPEIGEAEALRVLLVVLLVVCAATVVLLLVRIVRRALGLEKPCIVYHGTGILDGRTTGLADYVACPWCKPRRRARRFGKARA
jgi:hypothetical protein